MSKKSSLFYDELDTPVGTITILATDEGICRIDYGKMTDIYSACKAWSRKHFLCPEFIEEKARLVDIKQQLSNYFLGESKQFDAKFDLYGTPFQQKVWTTLYNVIPYGETRSYKEIAQAIQAPKAIRAVGGAINKNPIAIVIPCHRVIGSNGALVGYNGGIDKKIHLLQLEKAPIELG